MARVCAQLQVVRGCLRPERNAHGGHLHAADAIRWGSHGKAIPGNEIRILDPESGQPVPVGEPGEIVLRSAGVFRGYWNKPDATAKTLRNGWVHTGDIGRMDADGYLTFTGRFKEMIKVSGYTVFPEEVETILIKHPAVAQAAVIGVPDPTRAKWYAPLSCEAGPERDGRSAVAWSRENMATYKAPRDVQLHRRPAATGAGKVLRRLLKDDA